MDQISEKQLIANRENAKLGGVKTESGKDVAKFNALKHGILSKSTIITTGDGEEDIEMFEAITDRLVQDFQPVGLAEEILIDRMVSSYWRLQRVMRAEVGEIRLVQDSYIFNSIGKKADQENFHQKLIDTFRSERFKTSFGIRSLLNLVEAAEDEVRAEGFLSEETGDSLFKHFGEQGNNFAMMSAVINQLMKQEVVDGKPCPITPEAAKSSFLKLAQDQKDLLNSVLKNYEDKEDLEDESSLLATSVPDEKTLEKLTRYETALERSLYRALHELLRLQALRRGERPPTPLAIDVDIGQGG